MSEHEDNKQSLVILPLLCAVIGAVAFVCLSMSLINSQGLAAKELPGKDAHKPVVKSPPRPDIGALKDSLAILDSIIASIDTTSTSDSVNIGEIYGGRGGSGRRPQFVECVEDAVLFQPQGLKVKLSDISDDNDNFVKSLKATGYVVFCVRPDGFDSFEAARDVAEKNEIIVGYEPVNSDWALRF